MKYTSDYRYCEFPFTCWNKFQERCVDYFTRHINLVVSANVASGKTAIAEAIMGYELSKQNSKVLYVSPLKAISSEKYSDWIVHPTLMKYRIDLLDSDHHPEDISRSRIIIATIESVDIACRNHQEWLKDVSALIFDEAHMIGTEERGATSEAMLMEFTSISPDARIIFLSGTMTNAKEIAEWLNKLNGVDTTFVSSNWRPTKLHKLIEVKSNLRSQIDFIIEKIKSNPDEKILVFVHSKKIGQLIVEKMKKEGIRCSFFSSDLKEEQRSIVIERFKDQLSGLDVLIATSSLAMGVSL